MGMRWSIDMNTVTMDSEHSSQLSWLRRAGLFGFWFFMIKGILWLAAPLVFYYAI
jgi:hypothetical protein